MMETWLQITCDGCGSTDNTDMPNETRAQFRKYKSEYGWRKASGGLDYCRECVEKGALKILPNCMGGTLWELKNK